MESNVPYGEVSGDFISPEPAYTADLPDLTLKALKGVAALIDRAISLVSAERKIGEYYYEALALQSLEKARFWTEEMAKGVIDAYKLGVEFAPGSEPMMQNVKACVKEAINTSYGLPMYVIGVELIGTNLKEAYYFLGKLSVKSVQGS